MLSSMRALQGFRICGRTGAMVLSFLLPLAAQSTSGPIKNFYQVDEHVYRGGQPNKDGFDCLTKLGVKTVIDLREAEQRSKDEEKLVTAEGMKYVNVPMTGLHPPTEAETAKI